MLESKLVKQIKDWLENRGCLCWKYFGSVYGTKGFPDLFGILPPKVLIDNSDIKEPNLTDGGGRFFGIEVKIPPKMPTLVQEKVLRQIKEHGGIAFWADSLETVKAMLLDDLSTSNLDYPYKKE